MVRIRYSQNGLPLHDDGTQHRVLGALQPSREFKLPSFQAAFPTLPESEWTETSLSDWVVKIWDQGSYGSCVGQGTCAAFTLAWQLSGQRYEEFSPTFVYAHINGGRDDGAEVSKGLEAIKKSGTCLI